MASSSLSLVMDKTSTAMVQEQDETVEDDTVENQTIEISFSDNEGIMELNGELEKILDIQNTLSTPPPIIMMDPLECQIIQREEIETLKAIFDNDMNPLNTDCTCFSINIKYDNINNDDIIKIWFSLPPNYPSVPPVFEIEANQSGTFTFKDADELFDVLIKGAIDGLGDIMIYDMITICQEQLMTVLDMRKQENEKRLLRDEERKKLIELDDALKSKKGFIPSSLWPSDLLDTGAESQMNGAESLESEAESIINKHSKRNYHPREFIGSIDSIIKKLPPNLQITRIENIIRQDLAERFVDCQQTIINSLWKKERLNRLLYSLSPEIAFHGTLSKSLPSIVQHGLVVPGANNNPIIVRCGSSLGKGIYLSPDANFSLGYADSSRLIVCAVLRGIKHHQDTRLRVNPGIFFTIMSSCNSEWVFFNPAQVLPCYVIQVQANNSTIKLATGVPPPLVGVVNQMNTDENDKKKKEKLQARARKYLPFGFGPGNKTEILECGEIDDDEEDYGDYQLLRYNETDDYKTSRPTIEQETCLQEYRKTDNESF